MGIDTPLACLSNQPRLIYEYFRQLFAQVTNPPIDPIREEIVMSLGCYVGPEGNLMNVESSQCHRLYLSSPILDLQDLYYLRHMQTLDPKWRVGEIDITFSKSEKINGYMNTLDRICDQVTQLIHQGCRVVILSDRAVNNDRVAISTLVACAGLHHHLVRNKQRSRIAILVETGEAREIHHFCVLLGYGCDGICPYLALESMMKMHREGALDSSMTTEKLVKNFKKAADNGILKVMSKMGISTLQSYKGSQIFEALGIDHSVVDRCFTGTATRIKGIGFDMLALDALAFHELAWPTRATVLPRAIAEGGDYHWRDGGESHINSPSSIANLQDAVRRKNTSAYQTYSEKAYEEIKNCTLRGLLEFRSDTNSIPIDQVEPWTDIVKRFVTGAMSYGSISMEAHSALALAMNRLGGKSNTGEGGEDPQRSQPLSSGDSMRSAIKQCASGRFGVTSYYLSDAEELQIKMAQGAKPGEGGELPGHKVSESIAKTRKSTPGVGLISPPPHHDIYSIEDLKQLIYDLKCANTAARISVKLVSEVGVGIIASGVAKAKADHILISGHDGGTGASRWTGIRYAGLPWELGLAETHQTLVLNDLRGRIVLQTDGQIKTGRDVAIACLLGAEEWGFATTPLIAMGCTMMRKCHLNSCPVGIATQDPVLRTKFEGKPEHVINFFYYVAEELRSIMAKLGFRSINEMVGRTDMLVVTNDLLKNPKTKNLDLSAILTPAFKLRPGVPTVKTVQQDHKIAIRKDNKLIEQAKPALERRERVVLQSDINNLDRAFGTTLSYAVSKTFGEMGLPSDTIHVDLQGSAGQSFGAFLASGVTLELQGDANDYVGKGLSGGRIIVYPPRNSRFRSEENVIVGNVCLYGATSGQIYVRGIAAERFCVRNSGAIAVVEGVGDHGCEYMTGGRVVILGSTGRNFAAGMSGGIAYILDTQNELRRRCNMEMVELESVAEDEDVMFLKQAVHDHWKFTGSTVAEHVLKNWNRVLPQFVKVMPMDYKRVLLEMKAKSQQQNDSQQTHAQEEVIMFGGKSAAAAAAAAAEKTDSGALLVDIEDNVVDVELAQKREKNLDKIRGFIKYQRQTDKYRDPRRRIRDWNEVNKRLSPNELQVQAARCMDCGVPFCQSDTGCPISNIIPKWNDLVFKNQWKSALQRLLMTNNFPEFTGRVCPAPCESACVAGISEAPVAIKSIECAIIDRAFEEGWMVPRPPTMRTGKKVAIIGSGPAGLAAADQLNKAGHLVTVYEREDKAGGLLMYGIPNMKLDKRVVQRRLDLMAAEGVIFVTNAHVGKNVDVLKLKEENDALLIATGATWPRDLPIPNRQLDGIHFAMDYLTKNTKGLMTSFTADNHINARDKDVIVIGGGDTGCDCIGSAVRQGAKSVTNFELLPRPLNKRPDDNPWPQFPRVFKVDYGHAEAQVQYGRDPRDYCVLSKEFVSDGHGRLKGINTVQVEWTKDPSNGRWSMKEVPGSEKFYKADLVFLAMGFLGPENDLLKSLGVKQDARSNIETAKGTYATSVACVFAAGDCRRGQSLIVWGINEGRQAAREVDLYLMGETVGLFFY